ncbi:DUF2971 domain-containing protein [Niallia sp. FSL W8-0954]|uniref:DUF2971 domain-containing protein n=1 Tax=Niallia sp. FSL W8-0954 TaxID=2975338 RepID=UPI0030FAE7BE
MFGKVDPDKYLYHFTSYTTALEYILPQRTLRINSYSNMNDPRESKKWNFNVSYSRDKLDYIGFNEIQEKFHSNLKMKTKVLCFTKDNLDFNEMEFMTRGYLHPRMWAQYGGNHKGLCLMFDKSKLAKIIDDNLSPKGDIYQGAVRYGKFSINPFHVDYDELKSLGYEKFIKKQVKENYQELYFEKMLDWKDECEYRWVLVSDENSEFEYVHYKDSLVAIILGVDFPPVYETIIESYSKKFKINVVRMYWNNGQPSVLPVYMFENEELTDFKKVF